MLTSGHGRQIGRVVGWSWMGDTLTTRPRRRREPLRAAPLLADDPVDLRDELEPELRPWLRADAFDPPYA
jgi:hypothetical protein